VLVDVDSKEKVKKYSDSQKESIGAFNPHQSAKENEEWFS
jgi:hypothetical protein